MQGGLRAARVPSPSRVGPGAPFVGPCYATGAKMSDSGGGADQRAARSADNAGNQDYEYTGLVAETWVLLRGDTSGWPDRAFFQAIIRESGEPALDVGCATGRLVLDYLAEGLDADGLDVSPEMLALCRRTAAAGGL